MTIIPALTERLRGGCDLTRGEIDGAVAGLMEVGGDEAESAAFLVALRTKGETAGEIAGFAEALLAHAIDPQIDPGLAPGPLIDLCGTGGDKLDLFNVSTTAMFIVAAAGAAVVKHGNRAITSQSGGADVLEELGVRIDLPPVALRECVQRIGVGFLFAPAYHPAFKAIGAIRKRLAAQGIPTIFNLLGPLLNPARPPFQLIGIFCTETLHRYAEALALLGRERGWVVHGSGMDELSITGLNEVCEVAPPAAVRSFQIDPAQHGFAPATLAELRGGNRMQNAVTLMGILSGEIQGPRRDLVLLNTAAALQICALAGNLDTGLEMAREQVDSGRATAKLTALREWTGCQQRG